MSNATPNTATRTPTQLVTIIVLACLIPLAVIAMLAKKGGNVAPASTSPAEAVADRIQPIGSGNIKLEGGAARTGEDVFKAQCTACHTAGLVGAPKFGDAGAWGPRIGKGFDALLASALKGKGNMPAQGGGDFSDLEVARAMVYMTNAGGAKFDEPKAPAAADAASK